MSAGSPLLQRKSLGSESLGTSASVGSNPRYSAGGEFESPPGGAEPAGTDRHHRPPPPRLASSPSTGADEVRKAAPALLSSALVRNPNAPQASWASRARALASSKDFGWSTWMFFDDCHLRRQGNQMRTANQFGAVALGSDASSHGASENLDDDDDDDEGEEDCRSSLGSAANFKPGRTRYTNTTWGRGTASGSDLSAFSVGGGASLHQPQKVYRDSGESLTWSEVLYLWQHDDEFCDTFSDALCRCNYQDFFWEAIPTCAATAQRQPFEFVVVDAGGALSASPGNPRLFMQHVFTGQDSNQIVTFQHHQQKAVMVTPCQNGPAEEYAHLGSFLRSAPLEQVRNLWQTLGRTVEKTLSAQGRSESEPLWVSTNGIGMPWVHLRLDMSPRYFHYTLWKLHPQKLLKEEQASRASFSAPAPSTSTPRLPADSIQQDLGNQEPPGASEQGPGSDVRRRTPSHNCNPSDSSTHIRVGSDDLSFGGSGILLGVSSSSIKTVSSEDDLYAASNSDMKVKLGCFSACMGRLRVNRKPPGRRRAGRRSSLTSSSHLPPVQLGRLGPWGADMSVSRRQALLANHH